MNTTPLATMQREARDAVVMVLTECASGAPKPHLLLLAASVIARRVPTVLVPQAGEVVRLSQALAGGLNDSLLTPAFRAELVATLVARARELRELLEVGE